MLTLNLRISGALPASAPSLAQIAEIAKRFDRDLDNFAAWALCETARRAQNDADAAALAELVRLAGEPEGEPALFRIEITFPDGIEPSLQDIDALARRVGVSRDRLCRLAVALHAPYAQSWIDDPEVQAYWQDVAAELETLPDGYTTGLDP